MCAAVAGLFAFAALPTLPGGALAHTAPGARAATHGESRLQVTEIEYRLGLSSGVVKAGPVSLTALDGGMSSHDLHLKEANSSWQRASPVLSPGQRWRAVVDLRPGVYRLWCSLPEHARLGMRATLRVVR